MKEYDVKIREVVEKVVTIEASDRQAALDFAKDRWESCDLWIQENDFSECQYSIVNERDKELDKITALLVKPGQYPEVVKIDHDLDSLQKAVGGTIEVTYPFDEEVGIIVNEEGKLQGLTMNRSIEDDEGNIRDIYVGDFLVVGLTEESFCSLTDEQVKQFEEKFHQPQTFFRMGRNIMALDIPDDMVMKGGGSHADIKVHKNHEFLEK